MCPESENLHFLHIFCQHGYLTYYSHYLLENVYAHSVDVSGGKRVTKISQRYCPFATMAAATGVYPLNGLHAR